MTITKTATEWRTAARWLAFPAVLGVFVLSASESAVTSNRSARVPTGGNLQATNHVPAAAAVPEKSELPTAPEGVTDLSFQEIYRTPVGPLGLEFSEKARGLIGKKVRILGHMVKQTQPVPWAFLLSPLPMKLHEREYGFCEDLPAQTIHVFMQKNSTPVVPFTPGFLLLTGTLELGAREEADGRISYARLQLDPPTAEQRKILTAAVGKPAAPSDRTARPAADRP